MSLIRKHVAVLQAWACLALVIFAMTTTLESCTSLADIRQTDGQTDHAAVTLATIVGIAGAFISAA